MAAYIRVLLRPCQVFRRAIQLKDRDFSSLSSRDLLFSNTTTSFRCFASQQPSFEKNDDFLKDQGKGQQRRPPRPRSLLFGRDEQQNKILNVLDTNRSVKPGEFRRLFETIKQEKVEKDINISEQEASLLFHICCTGMYNLTPSQRVAAAEEVWSTLLEHGLKPSLRLFNMRLKVFKDNKHIIDPIKEMANLTDIGLTPDVVTYSMLLGCFCNAGDIEGADIILQTMKDLDLGVNVNVFNSYIRGHLKNNSLQQALDTLELLKARDLTPNAETYHTFACFYAQNGDPVNVKHFQNLSEENGFPFSDIQMLTVYKSFVLGGHEQMSKDFMDPLTEVRWFQFSIDMSSSLIADGMVKEGIELFNSYTDQVSNGRSSLLISMIESGHSPLSVANLAKNLVEKESTEDPNYQMYCEESTLLYCYSHRNNKHIDWAVEYLQLIKSKGVKLNPNYFVPALCAYKNNKDVEKLKKTTVQFIKILDSANSDFILETLRKVVYPALSEMGLSREDIRQIHPANSYVWNSVFFLDDLDSQGIDVAVSELGDKNMSTMILNRSWYVKKLEINTQKEAWKEKLNDTRNMSNANLAHYARDKILRGLIYGQFSQVECALDYIKDHNMTISDRIPKELLKESDPKELRDKFMELVAPKENISKQYQREEQVSIQDMNKMKAEELASLAETKFIAKSLWLTKVFSEHRAAQKIQDLYEDDNMKKKIIEFVKKLISSKWKWNKTHFPLVNYLIKADHVEDATVVFKSLADNLPFVNPDHVMMLALAQIDMGNFNECLHTLKTLSEKHTPNSFENERLLKSFENQANRIFEKASSIQQLEDIKHTFTYLPKGLEQKIYGYFVLHLMKFGSDEQIMTAVSEAVSKYNHFPMITQVLTRLVKNQNIDQLKVAMDLSLTNKKGSMFHSRLATAFLIADMPSKALKVLKTPGIQFSATDFPERADIFVMHKEIKPLEHLFEISKHFPVNQALMLDKLIQGYVSVDNIEKAVSAYETACQDSLVLKPLPSTITVMKNALTKKNMNIPLSLSGT